MSLFMVGGEKGPKSRFYLFFFWLRPLIINILEVFLNISFSHLCNMVNKWTLNNIALMDIQKNTLFLDILKRKLLQYSLKSFKLVNL